MTKVLKDRKRSMSKTISKASTVGHERTYSSRPPLKMSVEEANPDERTYSSRPPLKMSVEGANPDERTYSRRPPRKLSVEEANQDPGERGREATRGGGVLLAKKFL